ncbi:MAG: glycosyltransferase [Candidatus Shapirobacteria bacterium]|jgi:glycosyltransferase involved in cell wall biosynthesis
MKTPKVALFYDWLNQWGGAERVLLDLHKLYPDAPIYTLVYNPEKTAWLKNAKVITPDFLFKYPFFYPLMAQQLDFSDYDIVISTTSYFGHCLLTKPPTKYFCYCHTPNRYVWHKNYLKFYRPTDYIYGQRPDFFIASSKNSQQRILKFYNRDSTLIYPGIDTNKFVPKVTDYRLQITDYFLIVSRLVPHKKIDLAIRACLQSHRHLYIAGTGRCLGQLTALASQSPLIKFLGYVSEKKLLNLYQNCRALIHPQEEDFGLTALEVQSCGKPVIAFNQGGSLETIIDGKTGLFFNNQSTESLTEALEIFDSYNFKPADCRRNALRFSTQSFMLNFRNYINSVCSYR